MLTTLVEDYILAAMQRAVYEEVEDGAIGAWVDGFPGVLAFGADVHDCSTELYRLLQETVGGFLRTQQPVPVIAGIDLNCERDCLLPTYHTASAELSPRVVYETLEEFVAALDHRSE